MRATSSVGVVTSVSVASSTGVASSRGVEAGVAHRVGYLTHGAVQFVPDGLYIGISPGARVEASGAVR